MSNRPPFHLAFPVHDIETTRHFYGEILECREGRSAERWIDFDFFGHQVSAHLVDAMSSPAGHNPVDGDSIPTPHFGVVLPWDQWQVLNARLEAASVTFLIEARVRFEGQPGEQGTFFVKDPSGNVLEFKSFKSPDRLFATQ
mgnify:CR=1 FL=1